MTEKESTNANISRAVCNERATLAVHLGFSKRATGSAITVRTSTSNGGPCAISASIPKEKTRTRTTGEVKEVVLTMASREAAAGIVNLFRAPVREDTLGIIGMIVIISGPVG